MGHPGKYSYCIAEDEENSPWEPFHVERGFDREASTVTVMASLAPCQIDLVGAGTPEAILSAVADTLVGIGKGHGEIPLVVGQEHGGIIKRGGMGQGPGPGVHLREGPAHGRGVGRGQQGRGPGGRARG